MNKRCNETKKPTEYRSISFKDIDILESIKTIYLVKYQEIYYNPIASIKLNNTYNLFTFEDPDTAMHYMDSVYECIVKPYITNKLFKIMFNQTRESNNNKVIYERCTKLIGNNEDNCAHTRFYTFTVEKINFKPNINK